MKTQEEIEKLANEFYLKKAEEINNSITKGFIVSASKGGFVEGYTQCQKDMVKNSKEEFYKYGESLGIKINDLQRLRMLTCNEPSRNFYLRLKNFVSNVQVNDPMSEEEKEMIISVCNRQINKQN